MLEFHHGYIQWLFPNFEPGMNLDSQPLELEELEVIRMNNSCFLNNF